jgi:hypothetical protein
MMKSFIIHSKVRFTFTMYYDIAQSDTIVKLVHQKGQNLHITPFINCKGRFTFLRLLLHNVRKWTLKTLSPIIF